MRFGPYTNALDGNVITNSYLTVRAVGDPGIDAAGNVTGAIGLPLRVFLGADGMATNTLQNQNYFVTNALGSVAFLNKGYLFRAPLDSGPTVYSTTAPGILITGMNYFVTLGGTATTTNITFNQVTNGLGFTPLPNAGTNGFIGKPDGTNISTSISITYSNSLYSFFNTQLAIQSALGLTNAFATNAPGVVYSGGRIYVSTNYDALGTALAVGAGATNFTVSASNTLFALHSMSLTNAFATNAAGVTYVNGRAYISTNYDSLGAAVLSTNGFSSLVYTNPGTVAYTNQLLSLIQATNLALSVAAPLTNGFVGPGITNGFTTIQLLNSTSNTLATASSSGINAATATNINNAAAGVIATNGVGLTYKFSAAGTNAILAIAPTTNGLVDASITNNSATKAYAQSLTNGFVGSGITNNSATISLLNGASNLLQNAKMASTNGFSTNQVIAAGNGTNGFSMSDGNTLVKIDSPGSALKVSTLSSNYNISISVVDDNSGTGDIIGPQGQAFQFNVDGEIAMNDSGGEIIRASETEGILIQDGNDHAFQLDPITGNLTLTGGGSFAGDASQTTGKVSSTNGFAKNLTATNNTALEGSISFGPTGQATNIVSSTNYLYFVGAGTSLTTNGALVWNAALKIYTNWSNGSILTNNSTAWLYQTNGLTLYSLSGSSPIGAYSAVNGDLPAPAAYYTAAMNDHMVFLGPLSVTNLNAISNAIVVNGSFAAASNSIANNNGFGTNTYLVNPSATNWASVENFFFQFAANGQWNTNAGGAGFGAAVLSGATNRIFNHGASVIAGGMYNKVLGFGRNWGAILGGLSNVVDSGDAVSIAGGTMNSTLNSYYDFIGGGQFNVMTNAQWASILSGYYNTNVDTGGTILGGQSNFVRGNWSLAYGTKIIITNDNSVVFSDSPANTTTNSQFIIQATNGLTVLEGGLTVTNVNPGAALAALGVTASGQLTTNAVPGPGGGAGTVTSVGAAVPSGFSVSGTPITTAGTITITRSGDANNGGNGQMNIGALQATGLTQLGGQVTMNALIVTNGLTNSSLTAGTLTIADGNKKLASLANGVGVLTNDGNGVLGYLSPSSFGGGSPLTTNGLPGQTYRLSTNGVSQELTNFDAPLGWPFTKPIIWIVGGDSIPYGLNVAHAFWYYETNNFAPAGSIVLVDTNACVPGSQSTTILSRMRTEWAKYSTSNNFTVLSTVWIGVNDFNANTTWLQVYTNIDECAMEAHASNSLFMATCITPSTGMASANRYSLNWFNLNLINNTNRHWDFLMRPDLALLNSQPDSTLWVDDVHPTELGHSNVAYSVDYTLRHVQGSTYNPNILQGSHYILGYGTDPQGYAASVVGQAQYPFVDLYRPGAAALYFGPFANSDGGTADFHYNNSDSTHDGSTLFMQVRGKTNVWFRHAVTFTNAPELMLTNAAPGNTTTPKLWFPVTNNGAVFMVPGYQ